MFKFTFYQNFAAINIRLFIFSTKDEFPGELHSL